MSHSGTPQSPEDFDSRLKRARGEEEDAEGGGGEGLAGSGIGAALRMGMELVSALAVGVGIGWLLDHWLETTPWFLIVFFFIGAAAGILNIYRAAKGFGLAPGYGSDGLSKKD
ncbi:MAG: AtpZ/AtpI family protein [Rhodospirillales bacterium]|jgi:ATP synthase protein I|nr:AtpZ/AtpI family protein [Rhodospirillales bacterium]